MAKTIPLTATEVKQAKPTFRDGKLIMRKLSDGEGLQLRVQPNGKKSWFLDFINPYTKKRTSLGFGPYPAISLADARKLRMEARELLAKGVNPKDERDTARRLLSDEHDHTLIKVATQWFKMKENHITVGYGKDIWGSLTRHIFPKLGGYPITQLTAPRVIEVIRPLEENGKLDTIKRICQRINEIMTYAVNAGLITNNPLIGIGKVFSPVQTSNNPALEAHQLPELMSAISIANVRLTTRCLIEWQLHTMTRPNEAASAKWVDIDFENKLWIIPAAVMKTNVVHKVPLTYQMINLLTLLKPENGHREFLFPSSHKPKCHANASTVNMALKRMGFSGRQTAHGFRRLARTTLAEEGFNFEALEACLSHKVGTSVSQAYNHATYMNQRIKIMAWWSKHVEQAAMGNHSLAGRGC
ncbi:MAG: tyrosine-type recombinase/integrase [Psychromonas sp.]